MDNDDRAIPFPGAGATLRSGDIPGGAKRDSRGFDGLRALLLLLGEETGDVGDCNEDASIGLGGANMDFEKIEVFDEALAGLVVENMSATSLEDGLGGGGGANMLNRVLVGKVAVW